jgi:hypothetical protein
VVPDEARTSSGGCTASGRDFDLIVTHTATGAIYSAFL